MPFVEIKPARAGDRIRLSPRKGGGLFVSLGAAVLERNKLDAKSRFRLLADVEASPSMLRLQPNKDGPFALRITKGGAGVISCPQPPGLAKATFERCEAEWEELPGGALDIELPREWQRRPEAIEHKVIGNGRIASGGTVSLAKRAG